MQIFSATDAIAPAFARTRLILFSPFRPGRTWKLATTAYFGTFSAVFLPLPLLYLFFLPMLRAALGNGIALLATGGIVLFLFLFFFVFYLCTRLQFCLFDVTLNRGEFIAPAWRKYANQAWRWTWVKAAFGTAAMMVMALPIVAYIRHLIPIMRALQPHHPPPSNFVPAIMAAYGIIFLGFAVIFLAGAVLSDFIVPSLALENTSVTIAFRRFLLLARAEPGQLTGYILLKIVLAIAGYVAQALAFYAILLVYLIAMALVFALGFVLLHLLHVSMAIMAVLAAIIGGISYLVLCFYAALLLVGTVCTFLQAYTLYFLSGRYPLLGELLERSTPSPVALYDPTATYVPSYGPPPPGI